MNTIKRNKKLPKYMLYGLATMTAILGTISAQAAVTTINVGGSITPILHVGGNNDLFAVSNYKGVPKKDALDADVDDSTELGSLIAVDTSDSFTNTSLNTVTYEGREYVQFVFNANVTGQVDEITLDVFRIECEDGSGVLYDMDALGDMRIIFHEGGDDPFTPEVDSVNFSDGGASAVDLQVLVARSFFSGYDDTKEFVAKYNLTNINSGGFDTFAIGEGGTVSMPEPSTTLLTMLGGLILLAKRTRS